MRKGFTLIEILIVVAIIAILASIVLVGLGPTQQSGRDARRLSDLHEVQNALELYYNKCGFYPSGAANPDCPAAANLATYTDMSTALSGSPSTGGGAIPNDPTSGRAYYYESFSDSSGNAAVTYTLGATLENSNNSVWNGYTAPANTPGISCDKPNYCLTL